MKQYLLVTATVAALAAPALANPHPNPYSYPYATLPADKVELEQYTDLTPVRVERENPDGTVDGVFSLRWVLQTELELGLTDRLELGIYFQWQQGASADTPFLRFSGLKQRLRYRFAEAGELPVDIGIYGEIAELHDEFELEEKILLERRFGDISVVANLWVEQEYYFQTGETKYIYNPTLAFNYQASPKLFLGAEYWTRGRFDRSSASTPGTMATADAPTTGHHYLGPTLLYQTGMIFLSLGAYARLDGIADSQAVNEQYGKLWVRSIVGLEL